MSAKNKLESDFDRDVARNFVGADGDTSPVPSPGYGSSGTPPKDIDLSKPTRSKPIPDSGKKLSEWMKR